MNHIKRNFVTILNLIVLILISIGLFSCKSKKEIASNDRKLAEQLWMLSPIEKHDEIFPLLNSDTTSFFCPVTKKRVKWQESYVFNPATVVRGNKVYMIFRGEDKIGQYGGTSRLGLAVSEDGLNFKKYSDPILYPDNDSLLEYEKDGGI